MNFPSFGGHFSTVIPSIHHFASKFSQDNVISAPNHQENSNKYTANGIPSFTQHHHAAVHPSDPSQGLNGGKYPGNCTNQAIYSQQNDGRQEKRQNFESHQQEAAQELCTLTLQLQEKQNQKVIVQPPSNQTAQNQMPTSNQPASTTNVSSAWQTITSSGATVADYLSQLPASTLPLSLHHFLKYSAESVKSKESVGSHVNSVQRTPVPDGLSESNNVNLLNANGLNNLSSSGLSSLSTINTAQLQCLSGTKKKKKKKLEKEKKPRPKPGEIRLTTALDGSTLYCCPECHMAYPEKDLLEQHLVGHTMERRFVCDICGAGLKRKDHLTRHKQSHNPERPFACTVCLKAFKRKEQLTLHFVIHSGEKRHVCTECGKGFYRKDHLRKHTRSHIARRVKAELSQQGPSQTPHLHPPASTVPNTTDNAGILL
ncbi:unnamed protein product [Phaedon cochleariae]|uniref:C2H2-type domain-containing protein n=1 Tax=Phaedon cochleariae TaxID=80249 RepID=A0A9P0DCI9_PHACE|nr:unnamed protein product [Phaedon cochleariae]